MGFFIYFHLWVVLLCALIGLGIALFLRLKRKKSFVYLGYFGIFYIYLIVVLDYTLFQYQSLFIIKYFVQGLMLNGFEAGQSMNLIPLITLTAEDIKTSLLNILLFIPFGFGLPFITNLRIKKVIVAGALVSIAIELLQLVTGLMAHMSFRVVDINDVIFNTIGVVIGYILFVGFVGIYRRISRNWKVSGNPILRYIAERPQVDQYK
jgi:glycopeptide antibiotics resistance protein